MNILLIFACVLIIVIFCWGSYFRNKYKKMTAFFESKKIEEYVKNRNKQIQVPKEAGIIINEVLQIVEREYSSEVLNKQMEYSVLQSQINPHFLYNTLDSIRGEALMDGNDSIANMTEKLSKFFRYCISSKGDLVTIREEINNVLDYFFIQQYRFEDKFKLETAITENCYDYYIPKMTLQPIVENAIYHGLESKKDGGIVKISVIETENNLKINIEDNGVGIPEEQLINMNHKLENNEYFAKIDTLKKKTGIALYNVNYRIKLCYGKDYGILLRSTVTMGTDVTILVPKQNMGQMEKNERII